jgi:hypothetical protein
MKSKKGRVEKLNTGEIAKMFLESDDPVVRTYGTLMVEGKPYEETVFEVSETLGIPRKDIRNFFATMGWGQKEVEEMREKRKDKLSKDGKKE